jgi:hypothetical protein
MTDIYSFTPEEGILSWSEPLKLKRFGVLLAMRSRPLLIGMLFLTAFLYWLGSYFLQIQDGWLIGIAFILAFLFSYFSLLKQFFISDQVMFEENRVSLKRNGMWQSYLYANIREVMFFTLNSRNRSYPALTFIDKNGLSKQIIFLNEKQKKAVEQILKAKKIL